MRATATLALDRRRSRAPPARTEHAKSFKFDLFDFSEQDAVWGGTRVHLSAKHPDALGQSWVADTLGDAPANASSKRARFDAADIVLFNLDHHSHPFALPQKARREQMFAVTGHAPTSERPALWHTRHFTSLFDFTGK